MGRLDFVSSWGERDQDLLLRKNKNVQECWGGSMGTEPRLGEVSLMHCFDEYLGVFVHPQGQDTQATEIECSATIRP